MSKGMMAAEAPSAWRVLFDLGTLGGLTDAQLLQRFLDRDGRGSEDAFAALLDRHGPMVRAVCRRRLADPDRADDAFQAVFVVLVRRAADAARREQLGGWLHQVAVRVCRESIRQAARQHARERRAMGSLSTTSPAPSLPDPDSTDLLAALDEELSRLPDRYRTPIVLCDLEGHSRERAALLLDIPEGTLSSRLSRGRSLLKERLSRRGLSPSGSSVLLLQATTSIPPSLAASALHAASSKATPVVASLAKGVLLTMVLSKLQSGAVLGGGLVTAVALAAGIALAARPAGPPAVVEVPAIAEKHVPVKPADSRKAVARGVVVDSEDRPIPLATVHIDFHTGQVEGTTDGSGRFELPVGWLEGASVVASLRDPVRTLGAPHLGAARYPYRGFGDLSAPLRIVIQPARSLSVRVTDTDSRPIEAATVDVVSNFATVASASTGDDGVATLALPTGVPIQTIFAKKDGVGLDFQLLSQNEKGIPATEVPERIDLSLTGGRIAHVRVVDSAGKPVPGMSVAPMHVTLPKDGRLLSSWSVRACRAVTGDDGVATFSWLPRGLTEPLTLATFRDDCRFPIRTILKPDAEDGTTLVSQLVHVSSVSGRVTFPDGSPAPSIRLEIQGEGRAGCFDRFDMAPITRPDGTYQTEVEAEKVYRITVIDGEWAAPSHLGILVREGQDAPALDFRLQRGAELRISTTNGPDHTPVPNQSVISRESAGVLPEALEVREQPFHAHHEIRFAHDWSTRDQGRIQLRVGPGKYTVVGPDWRDQREIEVTDASDGQVIEVEFHQDGPSRTPVSGRVVLSDDPEKPSPHAYVMFVCRDELADRYAGYFETDADGRFSGDRKSGRVLAFALSADRKLVGTSDVDPNGQDVTIPVSPAASLKATVLDASGSPLANVHIHGGHRIRLPDFDIPRNHYLVAPIITDDQGRFQVDALVVGLDYEFLLTREGVEEPLIWLRPEKPGEIDLGVIQLGKIPPELTAPSLREATSAFRLDAPDAGAPAPDFEGTTLDGQPLKLSDLRGKFVLLDFQATWCGPCIGEIPNLEEVYKKHGTDDRFAMVSLSVDDEIDAPRAFHEKRPLPWTQAFLGESLHGPIPDSFGVRAIPAFVLIGPDGKIVARGMHGQEIGEAVARALATP